MNVQSPRPKIQQPSINSKVDEYRNKLFYKNKIAQSNSRLPQITSSRTNHLSLTNFDTNDTFSTDRSLRGNRMLNSIDISKFSNIFPKESKSDKHCQKIIETLDIEETKQMTEKLFEKELNPLLSYYHLNSRDPNIGKIQICEKTLSKHEKTLLFKKFNINTNVSTEEILENTVLNNSNDIVNMVTGKPIHEIKQQYFTDTVNSYLKIKKNKKIFESMMNVTINLQKLKFKKKIDEVRIHKVDSRE